MDRIPSILGDSIPSDPVLNRYVKSWPGRSGVVLISGPQGSGKTRCTFGKMLRLAHGYPCGLDGEIRFRLVVCRSTYPELWRTTIRTWWKMFPPDVVPGWRGSEPRSAEHVMRLSGAGGVVLNFEVQFVAPGEGQDMESFFAGLEASCIYLNEVGTFPERAVLDYALGRCGRYPDRSAGVVPWYGVVGDFNKPDVDHWLYGYVTSPPKNAVWCDQPGGLDPGAENLKNLPEDYYERFRDVPVDGDASWYRRMILNMWAPSRLGSPVHPMFDDRRHVSGGEVEAIPELGLVLGADQPRKPALVVMQWLASVGRWHVLDELFEVNCGAEQFGGAVNRLLRERYSGWGPDRIAAWMDPAGDTPGSRDDMTPMQVLRDVTGLSWRPAPGENRLSVRLEAVDSVLRSSADDGGPGLLVSPRCRMLISALAGKYHFPIVKRAGTRRRGEVPVKNDWANVADAFQAGLLGGGEYVAVTSRRESRHRMTRPVVAPMEFDPLR